MSVETHVHRAYDRVQCEQEAFEAMVEAYDAFLDRVSRIEPESAGTGTVPGGTPGHGGGVEAGGNAGAVTVGGAERYVGTRTTDRCRQVLTAFEETVRPHSTADADADEPLLETLRAELTDDIAVALAPTTETGFSAAVKRGVLTEASARRTEARVVRRALEREEECLSTAVELVDEATSWIDETDRTPMSEVGFDPLDRRHRTLSRFRDRCDDVVRDRQSLLRARTNRSADAGVRHRDLVGFLYEDFPVDHPVLSTVARLDETCRECQRAVRDHLVRRV